MPKINFHTPFLDENNDPIRKPKYDKTKTKVGASGNPVQPLLVDADGIVQYEDVMVNEILAATINSNITGDDALNYEQRLERGKLARKISDRSEGALKNYSVEQLAMIKDVCTRAQAVPALVAQVEQLIEDQGATDAQLAA